MNTAIRLILGLFLLASSIMTSAYETGKWSKVDQLYVKNNGQVFVYFEKDKLPNCYHEKGAFLSGSNTDRLYSMLMAAQMAGKKVLPLYQYKNKDSTGWDMCILEAVYIK